MYLGDCDVDGRVTGQTLAGLYTCENGIEKPCENAMYAFLGSVENLSTEKN